MASIINASSTLGLISSADTSGVLQLQTANTAALTIDASQNVGVGTSSLVSRLTVKASGNTYSTGSLALVGSSSGASYITNAGGTLYVSNDGSTDQLVLNSAGNLGLGVTPSAWSEGRAIERRFAGTADWGYLQAESYRTTNAYFNGGWKYGGTGAACKYGHVGGTHEWSIAASGTAGNAITFTQAMTLDASGLLQIGTTTAAASNAMLTVYNPNATSAQIALQNTTTGTGANGSRLLATGNDLYITNKEAGFMAFETSDTERARIDSSGYFMLNRTSALGSALFTMERNSNVGAFIYFNDTNTTSSQFNIQDFRRNGTQQGTITGTNNAIQYNTSSDYRLKNTIAPMTGALAKVAQLKPCTYKWNLDGSDGEGFIAHELAEVCPHAVTGEKDAVDEDGNPKYQGIDTSFLVATLTAAIQEQQAIIQQLQADVAALKG